MKFTVNCWCNVAKQYEIEATSEDEARDLAWSQFEDDNLNRCVLGDYGTDII